MDVNGLKTLVRKSKTAQEADAHIVASCKQRFGNDDICNKLKILNELSVVRTLSRRIPDGQLEAEISLDDYNSKLHFIVKNGLR